MLLVPSAALRLKPDSKTMKMRLASLLTAHQIYRRNRKDGFDEAHKIVKECEVGECTSEICHKLGKFYSNPVRIYSIFL